MNLKIMYAILYEEYIGHEMARRGRSSERQQKFLSLKKAPAYITRNIPYIEYLNEDGLVILEHQVDWLLENIGVEFRDNPHALDVWRHAGAKVEGCLIKADSQMIRDYCKTAPAEFVQHAKNPEKSVKIGGHHTVFASMYGAPFVHDLDNGRRYGSMQDFEKLVKIIQGLSSLHHMGLVVCEPVDIPVNKRHLDMLYYHMRYTDKPMLGAITTRQRAEESIEMAKILFGQDRMQQDCVIMGNVNTNSPLMVDTVVSDAIEVYCGNNQGIIVVPFILSGAMGPVSTAASIAQAVAEAMMCCAYSQIIKPGAPFVMGNFLSSMSLKTGAPTFGTPEPIISNYIIGQLARRLKLPLRCGGSLTASKLPDAQSASESADSIHSTIMGGANYILHAAGWMEGGLSMSFEKLVMDADRLAAMDVVLQGLSLDDNALARDAYHEVPPAGHFLGCSHTMQNYETAFFMSNISDNDSVEQWQANGSLDAAQRANKLWKKMLDDYQDPTLDRTIDDSLKDYIAKTKASRDDAWY